MNKQFVCILILCVFTAISVSAEEIKPKRFNLLFLMTDQHQAAVTGYDGNPVVKTPNLDMLAKDGVVFSAAYTACPVCVPARTSILTGRSIGGTGIRQNVDNFGSVPGMPLQNQKTFDGILNSRGYWSAWHGKWHSPIYLAGIRKTTDESFYHHFRYGLWKDDGTLRYRNLEHEDYLALVNEHEPFDISQLKDGLQYAHFFRRPYQPVTTDMSYGKPSPAEITERPIDKNGKLISQAATIGKLILDQKWSHTSFIRNLTVDTLQEAKNTGLPFNITASFNFPHPPVIATDPAFSLYRDKDGRPIKELDALISPSIDDRSKTSPYNLSTKDAIAYYYDRTKITDFMSVYYGLVSEVDDGIGKIVQKLKDIGEYDNTLIIYCSDHGEMLGAHGLIGKFVFYEESIRVPLILKLPNSAHKGLKIDRPVNLTDLFATVLDYTIGETKEESEGKSLRTLIENPQTKQWKDYTVSEWAAERLPVLCVITNDWKFLAGKNDKTRSALYDRKKDPNELVNLLYDISDEEREKYRGTVNDLKNKLLEYMTEIHHADTEAVRNFDYFIKIKQR